MQCCVGGIGCFGLHCTLKQDEAKVPMAQSKAWVLDQVPPQGNGFLGVFSVVLVRTCPMFLSRRACFHIIRG